MLKAAQKTAAAMISILDVFSLAGMNFLYLRMLREQAN
jgi:hypothetical protein